MTSSHEFHASHRSATFGRSLIQGYPIHSTPTATHTDHSRVPNVSPESVDWTHDTHRIQTKHIRTYMILYSDFTESPHYSHQFHDQIIIFHLQLRHRFQNAQVAGNPRLGLSKNHGFNLVQGYSHQLHVCNDIWYGVYSVDLYICKSHLYWFISKPFTS